MNSGSWINPAYPRWLTSDPILHHRAKPAHDFLHATGDLAQRGDFDRLKQSRKTIFTALDNIDKFIERAFRFLRILLFELRKPINLQLLFLPRRASEFYFRRILFAVAIFIQADDRTSTVVNLLLITMGGVLDLTALEPLFHRRKHPAQPLDFAELIENSHFHGTLHCFHARRAAQHVHGVFENAGLLQQDRLAMRREPDPFFARRREWFVRAV